MIDILMECLLKKKRKNVITFLLKISTLLCFYIHIWIQISDTKKNYHHLVLIYVLLSIMTEFIYVQLTIKIKCNYPFNMCDDICN